MLVLAINAAAAKPRVFATNPTAYCTLAKGSRKHNNNNNHENYKVNNK